MALADIFATAPTEAWIELWAACYAEEYGPDSEYKSLMQAVQVAGDDVSLRSALSELFAWKDPMRRRWERRLKGITMMRWNELQSLGDIPEIWENGIVYNVFLAHAFSDGKRPIIDKHAWRGYCYLTRRTKRPEFPLHRPTALRLYGEYESWFLGQVASGIDARRLDKALMAFGQFCGGQFKPIATGFCT